MADRTGGSNESSVAADQPRGPVGEIQRRDQGLAFLLLLIAVLVAFGEVLPHFGATTDDLRKTTRQAELSQRFPSLLDQWRAILVDAEGGGHYKPFQDILSAAIFHSVGWKDWGRVTMALYLLLHAGSAFLLLRLAHRFGNPSVVGFSCALLFAVHPMLDESLAAVQFAPNIPGLFLLLAALDAWVGRPGAPPRWRLIGIFFLVWASQGCNVGFLFATPFALLVAELATYTRWTWRGLAASVARLSVPALGTAASLVMRWRWYGTLGTKVSGYENEVQDLNLIGFLGHFWEHTKSFEPTLHAVVNAQRQAPLLEPMEFACRWGSSEAFVIVAVGVSLVWWALRRLSPTPVKRRVVGPVRSLSVGLGLMIGSLLPYALFLGANAGAFHRYVQPALGGLALALGGLVTWALGSLPEGRRSTGSRVLLAAVVIPTVVSFLAVDRESARSIAAAHRLVTRALDFVAADLQDEPQVQRVYFIGFPRVLGRAGFTFQYEENLRGALNLRLASDRQIQADGYEAFYESVFVELTPERSGSGVIPALAAVFESVQGGDAVERVSDLERLSLDVSDPLLTSAERDRRLGYRFVNRELFDADRVQAELSGDDPEEVMATLACLRFRTAFRDRLRPALVSAFSARPVTTGAIPFAGLVHPRARVRALQVVVCGDPLWLAHGTLNDAAGDPSVLRECLRSVCRETDDPWRRGGMALHAALELQGDVEDLVESALWRDMTRGVDPSRLRAAIAAHRTALSLIRRNEDVAVCLQALEAASAAYEGGSVAASGLAIARARLRLSADPHSAVAETVGVDLDAERLALLASLAGEPIPLHLDATPSSHWTSEHVSVRLSNLSRWHLPGGVSPYSVRVVTRWDGGEATEERWIPHDGIPPGHERTLVLRLPKEPTEATSLNLTVVALGRTLAGVSIPRKPG